MNTIDSLTTEIKEILKEKAVQDVKVLDQQRNILNLKVARNFSHYSKRQ